MVSGAHGAKSVPDDLVLETLAYRSGIDGVGPLYADCIFQKGGHPKPLTAVLHGFHCTRGHVTLDAIALARRGLFCVAADMRGHGDSAGAHDCGALQICDIVDALGEAAGRFQGECDPRHVNAVGYSGGGGNVLSLATKFPELLSAGASFFGISDYEAWYRTRGREDCNRTMDRAVGGSPDVYPERYDARSSLKAVGNNRHTELRLFWDTEEKACPPLLNDWFVDAARRLGQTNVQGCVSRPGDASRWHHGYRTDLSELGEADAIFAPSFLASAYPLRIPEQGELVVCGYVVTTRFAVWLGDGKSGAVRVRYDLTGGRPVVECMDGATRPDMRVVEGPTCLDWFAHG